MTRTVNEYWDDLDRDPSPIGLKFAQDFYGHDHSPNCHAVQQLAVFYDKFEPDWHRIARELNDNVVLPSGIAGNHLATHAVLRNWPDWRETDPLVALEHFGAGLEYDAWCAYRLLMMASEAKREIKVAE